MFHGKLRIHTCKIILLTSLVWFLVDVVILSFYSECLGGACKKPTDNDNVAPVAESLIDNINDKEYEQEVENNVEESVNKM